MIYLSGAISKEMLGHPRPDLGAMMQPGMGNAVQLNWLSWGADNGCFARGYDFDPGDWLEWLAGQRRFRKSCLFAVAPDVVGDAAATIERSSLYLPTIRQLNFPAALAFQNGLENLDVPWDDFDVAFIGGTTDWKLSQEAFGLIKDAKARGMWVHVGRVNSMSRLQMMHLIGADSCDGTYVKYGPERNLPRVHEWLDQVNGQQIFREVA